jgi:hypothetical protein
VWLDQGLHLLAATGHIKGLVERFKEHFLQIKSIN